ncbi:MAG TPA: hypothetical protein VIE43_23685 [Thermoanaerobaculia bacterium]|jgi:hypothetical protein|nr:hypothetical protein [Thermoanaerobaculia bacterium]
MGTFHQNRGELHGITVIVDTTGPEIFVGRCNDEDDRGIFLFEADVHLDGEGGRSKEEYVRRVSQLGFWKKHDHLMIPREKIVSVRKLSEVG